MPWQGSNWAEHGLHVRRLAGIDDAQCVQNLSCAETAKRPHQLTIESDPTRAVHELNSLISSHAFASSSTLAVASDGAILHRHFEHIAASGYAIFCEAQVTEVGVCILGASRCAYDAEVAGLTQAIARISTFP